jgi:bifunctional DNA-binding transcriptional regulator/antitoxin component of YhaV-PrlF toxin-antitoxin module
MRTTVTSRGQTVVPAKIRRDRQIGKRTKLEWIDDGSSIRVVPVAADPVRAVKGTTKGLRRKLVAERNRERRGG